MEIYYVWLIAAIVDIGLILFIIRLHLRKRKTNKAAKTKGRIGVVENLKFTSGNESKKRITVFQIRESEGVVFYAGVDGHDRKLSEGDQIELWPLKEKIFEDRSLFKIVSNQGTLRPVRKSTAYWRLKNYRILSEQAQPDINAKSGNIIRLSERR